MSPADTHLELYVRSLGTSESFERQERYLDRLEALRTTGLIDDFSVVVWGTTITPGSHSTHTRPGSQLVHRLLVMRRWCRHNGADVTQLYRLQDDATLEVAPIALAEFTRSRLQFVSPYADAETRISVDDHLDSLAPSSDVRLVERTDALAIEDPRRSGYRNGPSKPKSNETIPAE